MLPQDVLHLGVEIWVLSASISSKANSPTSRIQIHHPPSVLVSREEFPRGFQAVSSVQADHRMLRIKLRRLPSRAKALGHRRSRYQRRNVMLGIQAQTVLRAKGVDQLRDVLLVELAQVIGKLLMENFVEGYLDRTAKRSALLSKYLQVVRCQAVHGGVFAGFEQSSSSRVLTNGYQSDNNGSHLWSR